MCRKKVEYLVICSFLYENMLDAFRKTSNNDYNQNKNQRGAKNVQFAGNKCQDANARYSH